MGPVRQPRIDVDRMLADLDELLAIPSLGGTPAESDAQRHLASRWRAEGLEVAEWDIDVVALATDPQFPGMEVSREHAVGVTARLSGTGDGPTIMLNGHTDVVPAGDLTQWSGDPFEPRHLARDGERVVVGRGACDMKGGLVAAWAAVRAIADADVPLRGDVLLAPVVGEEDGGLGTFALLRRGVRADLCIVPEPTELDIVPANAGALTFRIVVRGAATHASRRLHGVNAIDKFVRVMQAVMADEAARNEHVDPLMSQWDLAYPTSFGTVSAGDWASTVPDLLVAEGRLGVALGESVRDARQHFESVVAAECAQDPWLREHPVEVEWWGGQFASGRTDPDHPLVKELSAVHRRRHGNMPEVYGGPYGSDLRLLTGIGGIPTVQYGPGSAAHAHAPDEFVRVADLERCAATLVDYLVRTCGP